MYTGTGFVISKQFPYDSEILKANTPPQKISVLEGKCSEKKYAKRISKIINGEG